MKNYFIRTNGNIKKVSKKEFFKKAYKNMLKLETLYKNEPIIETMLEYNLELQKYYKYFKKDTQKLENEYWNFWNII